MAGSTCSRCWSRRSRRSSAFCRPPARLWCLSATMWTADRTPAVSSIGCASARCPTSSACTCAAITRSGSRTSSPTSASGRVGSTAAGWRRSQATASGRRSERTTRRGLWDCSRTSRRRCPAPTAPSCARSITITRSAAISSSMPASGPVCRSPSNRSTICCGFATASCTRLPTTATSSCTAIPS